MLIADGWMLIEGLIAGDERVHPISNHPSAIGNQQSAMFSIPA
jgi:hypothetical protein